MSVSPNHDTVVLPENPIQLTILIYLARPTSKLAILLETIEQALPNASDYEIIVLDDGTATGRLHTRQNVSDRPHLKIVQFGRQFGESVAVDAAMKMARGDYVMTLPATRPVTKSDLQTLTGGIQDGVDLLIGYRTGRMQGLLDRLQVKTFYWMTQRASGARFRDLSSGIRIFRRELATEIPLYGDMIRFLPVWATGRGYEVREFQVQTPHHPEQEKAPSIGKRVEEFQPLVYLNRLLDVLTLFFLIRFTKKPLRFFGAMGAFLLVPGLLIDLHMLITRLFLGGAVAGRPLLLLGILLTVLGVQVISIGLIGEMIIFTHARESRDYSIREILE